MKFLVDAHLPRRLAYSLRKLGHDAIHTLDLPLANRTPDAAINELTVREQRILVTKDADFVDSFFVQHQPYKLLLVSTGNIKNIELEALIIEYIAQVAAEFESHDFIEIDRKMLAIHV